MNHWNAKTILLTGASSGIGEALAIALAKKGAIVGLLARRKELLDKLKKQCEKAGGTARVFACDVTDEDAVMVRPTSSTQNLTGSTFSSPMQGSAATMRKHVLCSLWP